MSIYFNCISSYIYDAYCFVRYKININLKNPRAGYCDNNYDQIKITGFTFII